MISQERKDQLKSEWEEYELQDKIKEYHLIYIFRKIVLLFAAINLFYLFLIFVTTPFFFTESMWVQLFVYPVVLLPLLWFYNQKRKKLSQPMACYAAVSAAEQLENDNLIEASFCADKLLEALSFLVKHESIEVISWKSSLKNLLYVQPRDIKNKAVHGAIQDSTATKNDFAVPFYELADSLSKDLTSREFMAIRDFLEWLSGKSQNYESKIGFWARHQNYKILRDIMAIIAPIIVAILMLIGYRLIPAM